jgi:hypothetical protein
VPQAHRGADAAYPSLPGDHRAPDKMPPARETPPYQSTRKSGSISVSRSSTAKRCSGLAIKSVPMKSPMSRAADRERVATRTAHGS